MKITDLTNEQLDYWTAKAQGWELDENPNGATNWVRDDEWMRKYSYTPSTNWQQAGELVEKFKLTLLYNELKEEWIADEFSSFGDDEQRADSPRKAICMACIASVYGEEIPDEDM